MARVRVSSGKRLKITGFYGLEAPIASGRTLLAGRSISF
jgi:hypothetical protein